MILEFLSEVDAISAFDFSEENLNKFSEHPLFINIEIHRYPLPESFKGTVDLHKNIFDIFVSYNSGIENINVKRNVNVRRYKNILRLIPEQPRYEWIVKEIIDLFINNKKYNIIT